MNGCTRQVFITTADRYVVPLSLCAVKIYVLQRTAIVKCRVSNTRYCFGYGYLAQMAATSKRISWNRSNTIINNCSS